MRTAKFIVGPTAKGSGSAPVHSNSSSAITDHLEFARPIAEVGEESVDRVSHLGAPVEAVPDATQGADQLVARVDRHEEELARPRDDRLDVRRELLRQPRRSRRTRPTRRVGAGSPSLRRGSDTAQPRGPRASRGRRTRSTPGSRVRSTSPRRGRTSRPAPRGWGRPGTGRDSDPTMGVGRVRGDTSRRCRRTRACADPCRRRGGGRARRGGDRTAGTA